MPFSSYRQFWPHYVREHSLPLTRRLHFVGTALVLGCLLTALVTGNAWWLLGVPLGGYGFAWVGHFFVEHNRPATFTHPLWSLRGDFQMFALMLGGRMEEEVRKAQGEARPQ